eukprot:3594328-Alexandrium_andersonii.AAC.1
MQDRPLPSPRLLPSVGPGLPAARLRLADSVRQARLASRARLRYWRGPAGVAGAVRHLSDSRFSERRAHA